MAKPWVRVLRPYLHLAPYCRNPNTHKHCEPKTYLVVSGSDKGIVAKVAADIGRDDFAVDAIARDEVFILPRCASTNWCCCVAGLTARHYYGGNGQNESCRDRGMMGREEKQECTREKRERERGRECGKWGRGARAKEVKWKREEEREREEEEKGGEGGDGERIRKRSVV